MFRSGFVPSLGDAVLPFESGRFVRLKTDPERSGVVQAGARIVAGRLMIPVKRSSGQTEFLPEDVLELVPEVAGGLLERFSSGQFVEPGWLQRMITQMRVTGRLDDVFYSMEATKTDFLPYQFKPVLKLLNSPTDSLLIADEVGLGKTIEAGLIWTELRARLDCQRLLILCPKTLREKWRSELKNRFGVSARVVNAKELHELLESNTKKKEEFAVIATIQAVIPPKNWDKKSEDEPGNESRLENKGSKSRRNLAECLDAAAGEEPLIDLFVIDEAHHMRNPQTSSHKLAQLLNAVSAHRLFLSATPIHLRNRDLHSLMKLIDPDTFEFESTLESLIASNQPVIEARDMLLRGKGEKDEILERLESARQDETLRSSKSLALAVRRLQESELDTVARSDIAHRLETANQMSNYLTRTRRRDVEELRIQRDAKNPFFEMSHGERLFYDKVTEKVVIYADSLSANARFLLSTPLRLLTSSPAAASAHWSGLSQGIGDDLEETDDDLLEETADEGPLRSLLKILAKDLNMTGQLRTEDTKFNVLIKQLKDFWDEHPKEKIVIFASFKATLGYLSERLEKEGVGHEMIHGSIRDDRDDVLKRFKEDPSKNVLLSSEVGSEGIDLQFCWAVINYDLPWNPMRVEQRIGRIDRLGQPKDKVMIVSLLYNDTIDAEIYKRLHKRLLLAERALGTFEAVLGEPIRNMERKLLNPHITEKQRLAAIEQTAQVAESNKKEEDRLEAEAGALIQHGDYVMQKIQEARNSHRWLDDRDVLVFVKNGLDEFFHGCRIEEAPVESGVYRITLTADARENLAAFIARKGVKFRTRLLHESSAQRYKFTALVVREDEGKIESISQLHPLVRLIVDMQSKENKYASSEPVAAQISVQASGIDCAPDGYVIGIMRWDMGQTYERQSAVSKIGYAGAELSRCRLITAQLAESIAGAVASAGRPLPNMQNHPRLMNASELLKSEVVPELDRMYEDFHEQTRAGIEDRAEIRKLALLQHRETKQTMLKAQHTSHIENALAAEDQGDVKTAQRLRALAAAVEGRKAKLVSKVDIRLRQIEQLREVEPAFSPISYLFVDVLP